jgi:phosphopantetheinyl transferase (holo-ACP synthase)
MEVLRGESGAPTMIFSGNAADFIAAEGIASVQVSLSHARDYAAANAVAIRQLA